MNETPKKRLVKKRHLASLGAAALTVAGVLEAGAPLCPVVDLLSPRAGEVCRALTLAGARVKQAGEALPLEAAVPGQVDGGAP